jgi:uncharacterized protein YbcI
MVAVVREAVGRGPKRARTFIHDDVIVCLLHETMTPLERTLHQQNRDDTVQTVRDVPHTAMARKAQQSAVSSSRGRGRSRAAYRSAPDGARLPSWLTAPSAHW